jgi:hypothetical protein
MTERNCPQSECQLAASGKCLEGFEPPEKCPYLLSEDQHHTEQAAADEDTADLPSGEALTAAQASDVARSGPTKVIIIAGPYGSGKTTILTSLFEAFQEAPFGNYTFRGSRTLVGFERRSHLGRKESGQEYADTPHTSAGEGVRFLHLSLAFRSQLGLDYANLLLSDISGELFKRLRDASDSVNELVSLDRANHLCLVIDGQKIVDRETRHVARNDSRSILRSILESGRLARDCAIEIAITKWDLVVEAFQREGVTDLRSFVEETLRAVQGVATGYEVRVHEVAARPPVVAKVPFAHGLPTLLRSWMDHDTIQPVKRSVYSIVNPSREIDRFTRAVMARIELTGESDASRI